MVEQTVSTFGRLDAVFNNAAWGRNLRGIWNCMKHKVREQKSRRDCQLLLNRRPDANFIASHVDGLDSSFGEVQKRVSLKSGTASVRNLPD